MTWRGSVRRREWSTALLVAMPLVALVPKWLLILHTLGSASTQVFETGFGFGGYVRGLLVDRSFHSCAALPFKPCDPSLCVYATRMPLLPLFYAALAKFLGIQSVQIAIAKCTLTAGLLTVFLRSLTRDMRFSIPAVLLAYALYLGPQVLKHAASLEYEEGLLVDLEACFAIAVAYLLTPDLTPVNAKRLGMACAAVLLGTAMYFIKTTALPLLVVSIALVLSSRDLQWRPKMILLLCTLAPFAGWAAHNYSSSRGIQLSSSWNGENLYRGSSSEGLALYPEVLLDRLFDSAHATLSDGRIVLLQALKSQRCFTDEWAWSRYYTERARSWSEHHPADALKFVGHKAWVALFELRHTPYRMTAEGPDTEYPLAIATAMFVWMGFARLVFWTLVALLVRDVWRGNVLRSAWTLALLGAGLAPYVLVFAYQRHIVPLLVMAGLLLLALYLGEPRQTSDGST